MTTKQLSNLKNLKAEIKMYEEIITGLSNLPKNISNKNGYSVAKIIDTKDKLSKDYAEIINYIKNIDNPIVSMILKYKYINDFSWQKTALENDYCFQIYISVLPKYSYYSKNYYF